MGTFMESKLSISKDKILVREVYVGGCSKDDLLKKLEENKISINEFALNIISNKKFKTSTVRRKLQTAEISVRNLGFPNGATTSEIYQKAKDCGLNLCPHELALHMRLQHIDLNQPIDPLKVTG